jgi:hypothetical protein
LEADAIMATNFLQLSAELRIRIYEFALLTRRPIYLTDKFFPDPAPAYALLRVNKTIYSEANAIFYSQNEFQITNCPNSRPGCFVCTPEQADVFFSSLGRNGILIRKVNLQFPSLIVSEEGDKFFLKAEDSAMLRIVERHCVGLQALKLHFPGTMLEYLDTCRDRWDLHPTFSIPFDECCRKAFLTINVRLKNVLSTPEIIVNLGKELDTISYGLMKDLGWKPEKGTPPKHWHPTHERNDDDDDQSIVATWRPIPMDGHESNFIVSWE